MTELFEEYVPRVYLFALRLTGNREEAEELTQETFLQAIEHRASLRDPAAVRAWLFTIAVNRWRSGLRHKEREERLTSGASELGARRAPLPEEELVIQEDLRRVRDAMDGLPARQREVLYLHACEGFTLQAIADILGIRPEAVKASLSLARKRMRQHLKDLDRQRLPRSESCS